jgi:hypothetical protein
MLRGRMDPNYWGLIVVPLGIFLCFSPVLIAWAFTKDRPADTDKDKKH